MITITSQFDRSKLDKTKDNEGYLMVSLKAEDPDFKRTPVQVILCLDVSGSIDSACASGQKKIDALKEVARKLVENMTGQDEVAIVTFTDDAELKLKLQSPANKEPIFNVISGLNSTNSTNMSAGLLLSFQQVVSAFKGVRRIMLLSDGLPNRGVADKGALVELVKKRDADCTISTFAFGLDADQKFLEDLAKAGGGNNYFINDAKDIKDVFARELGGIASCLAQNIKLTLKPNPDNGVLEVLNDFTVDEMKKGGGGGVDLADYSVAAVIHAEDIYVGETKHILTKMKIGQPTGKIKDRPFSIVHVEVEYDDLKTNKHEKVDQNVKAEFVKPEEADKSPILAVAEQVAVLQAAKAQEKAVEAANKGDWAAVKLCYAQGMGVLKEAADAGSEYAGTIMDDYIAEEVNFDSASYNATYGAAIKTSAAGMKKFRSTGARGMSARVANAAQAEMVDKFMAPPSAPHAGGSPFVGGLTNGPKVNPVVPKVESPVVKPVEPKSGFTKTRSRSKK